MSLTNFDQDQSRINQDESNISNEVNSTVATPEEFVTKFGGKRVINKILIANNGIAGKYVIDKRVRDYYLKLRLKQIFLQSCHSLPNIYYL